MKKGKGWIILNKQILDHWLYKDKPFNKSMAWIDLLLIADHTTHTSLWRGKPTEFKRGDVNMSITELAKRWGWSRDRARRFVSLLEQDGMLRTNRTPNRTTLTIVKYDDYQDVRTVNKATDKTMECASDKAADNTYLKNNKRIIKEIKEEPAAQFSNSEEEDVNEWFESLEDESEKWFGKKDD